MNGKQIRLLIVLAAIAVAAFGTRLWLDRLWAAPPVRYSATNWSYANVFGIGIIRENEPLRFVRDGETWRLEDDRDFEVDHARAVALVNNCRYLSIRETVEGGIPREQLGLDTPAYSIEVSLPGGRAETFDIGAWTADRSGRFAKNRDDDVVFVIESYADAVFSLPKDQFLNRKPRQIDWPALLELVYYSGGRFQIALERGSDREPVMQTFPVAAYTNSQALEEFAFRIMRFSFADFVSYVYGPGDLGPYGLDEPSLVIGAKDPEGRFGILLGRRDGQVVYGMRAEAPGAVFSVPYADVEWMYSQSDTSFASSYLFYGDERYVESGYDDIEIAIEGDFSGLFAVKPEGGGYAFSIDGSAIDEQLAVAIVTGLADLKTAGRANEQKAGRQLFTIKARMSRLLVTQCDFYEYDNVFYAVDQGFGLYFLARREQIDGFAGLIVTGSGKNQ